jgi:hypothetical protein
MARPINPSVLPTPEVNGEVDDELEVPVLPTPQP